MVFKEIRRFAEQRVIICAEISPVTIEGCWRAYTTLEESFQEGTGKKLV